MGRLRRFIGTTGAICLALVLAACGGSPNPSPSVATKKSVVCTTFASYDWMRELVGTCDDIELTYLLDDGVDMHSFQPTVADLALISSSDLVVYCGGESETWVDDALESAKNENVRGLRLLDIVQDASVEEEIVEGMQEEAEGDEHHGEVELDEHVWLSPELAGRIVGAFAEELSAIDEKDAELFRKNAEAYQAKLKDLDDRYQEVVRSSARDTLVFCDRFPFRYLTEELGLNYYAAFPGCSAETEASFETVAFLISKVDELGLKSVLVCEDSDKRIADSVIANTKSRDQEILTMDSLQSVSADEVAQGRTYLSAMDENLEVLREALA